MKSKGIKHLHWVVFFFDVLAVAVSYWMAFQLRFDFAVPELYSKSLFNTVLIVVGFRLVSFYYFNLYKGIWRYASINDLTSIFKAIVASQVAILAVIPSFYRVNFPRSVLIIDPVLTIILIGGIRFFIRLTRELRYKGNTNELPKVLIFGAGDLGESILREIKRDKIHKYHVVGFIDDNPEMWHHHIHGTPILGGRNMLPKIIAKYSVDEVVIAVNHSRGKLIGDLISLYKNSQILKKVQFKTVPTLSESLTHSSRSGRVLRNIELSDLLNRKQVQTDMEAVSLLIGGKTVFITGAGGTIGAELCRQIVRFHPKTLLMLENHNTALFYIDKELSELSENSKIVSLAGDVRDQSLLNNIFSKYKPGIVFHAAAHKHVPLMESNPQEAVKNNTLATHLLAATAVAHGTEKVLFISTDKAVRPSSIMGASKRLGEMVISEMAASSQTKFMSVRFGNVLGSSGSAVNIFKEQIANGGPVTVTHSDATRYFMTTQEAIQLILQACAMGYGGEIFVLNMGEPVKVLDLVKNLILLAGLEPDKDIAIRFTSLRPGEKLHEELFRDDDIRKDTGHPDIFMAIPEGAVLSKAQVMELAKLCEIAEPKPLLTYIKELIPAYKSVPIDKHAFFHGMDYTE
ncbi:MAG: polysaccharide biosynthesis protein [Elusimicrobia bacterium]|nr:polysaccharide biosynthesis protein [Elusimicrobiota bacterium]